MSAGQGCEAYHKVILQLLDRLQRALIVENHRNHLLTVGVEDHLLRDLLPTKFGLELLEYTRIDIL